MTARQSNNRRFFALRAIPSNPRRAACLIALLLAALLPSARLTPTVAAAGLSFTPQFIGAPLRSRQLVFGDLNGDGALDIVQANLNDNNTAPSKYYLNDGAGHYSAGATFGAPADTRSVAVGDLNGDGALDIVQANGPNAAGIPNLIFYNDGKGHFGDGVAFGAAGLDTYYVAVGDLNGDGRLDIVLLTVAGAVALLNDGDPNDGHGGFPTGTSFGLPAGNGVLALGDLNGDGFLDVVQGGYVSTVVSINNQQGGFPTSTALPSGGVAALGDMNGDGFLDIVQSFNSGPGRIYLNDKNGGFPTSLNYSTNGTSFGVAVADINGDGAPDIIRPRFGSSSLIFLNLNDGSGNVGSGIAYSDAGANLPYTVSVGDVNGDGLLDIAQGSDIQQSVIYVNQEPGGFASGTRIGPGAGATSLAVGDLNRNGRLDIVQGIYGGRSTVLINNGGGTFSSPTPFGEVTNTTSVALGDMDGDGNLDIVQANWGQQTRVFLNNGVGVFSDTGILIGSPTNPWTEGSVALGDVNGDGALDIVLGSLFYTKGIVYINSGNGQSFTPHFFGGQSSTYSVALGDLNGDGALDIVQANNGQPTLVFLNDGQGNFTIGTPLESAIHQTKSVAVSDLNGDGALDIVESNWGETSAIFLNDGRGNFPTRLPFGGANNTESVAVGDVNGDGAPDIVQGNTYQQTTIYLNNGRADFSRAIYLTGSNDARSAVLGDLNGDGALDIASSTPNTDALRFFPNRMLGTSPLQSTLSAVSIRRPGSTPDADFYSSTDLLSQQVISIPYALTDPQSDKVRVVRGFFSLDGGGSWRPAITNNVTDTLDVSTSPTGSNHTFAWDTAASGLFGESDNVVFRIEAYPSPTTGPKQAPQFERPFASATTFRFRVRGSQVLVQQLATATTAPATLTHKLLLPIAVSHAPGALPAVPTSSAGAIVYRIRPGQVGTPLANGVGKPFHTDAHGYLGGRGEIESGDQLVALQPIAATSAYTVYLTNATPTPTGLEGYTVAASGVQTLTVSAANPLVLFNLSVALEWDARNDTKFRSDLAFDLQRTSELLYDWTNGQAALGAITVYHAKAHWDDANIRLNASNRLRPSANQGGIAEPFNQIRIGAVWNRFGDPSGNQGEDWPRALAHELGHYAFDLDDNYLGLDSAGKLISVSGCPGAMSDPYRDDQSEFHPRADWLPGCQNTLANRTTGQADWETIVSVYPWLHAPTTTFKQVNPGPSHLPLAVTQIQFVPDDAAAALAAPVFNLTRAEDGGRLLPGDRARAFLFKRSDGNVADLVDLGRPALDQVQARGAAVGDRLCVYELEAARLGCTDITAGTTQLALGTRADWRPQLIITPVTSRTLALTVPAAGVGAPAPSSLLAQVFPSDIAGAPSSALLTLQNGQYQGSITLDTTSLEGYVQVLVPNDTAPGREIVTDYALGGNPAPPRRPRRRTRRRAPAMSTDGQVIMYSKDLDFANGEFYAIQTATALPPPPLWATFVGQGYWLIDSPGAPALEGVALNVSYADADVAPGTADGVSLYRWDGTAWQLLPGLERGVAGEVTAPISQAGLYVLMSSAEIPLKAGINLVAYPIAGERPVGEALASIAGAYTTVRSYDPATGRWLIYTAGAPEYANSLKMLEYGKGYEIRVTRDVTLLLRGEDAQPTTAMARISPPSAFPPAPARYYGEVSAGSLPSAGQTVWATIHGRLCGAGQTQLVAGQIVYAVDVAADTAVAGCGAPGRQVTIALDGRGLARDVGWDNQQAHEVNLAH